VLRHCARILNIDVLWGDLPIGQRGLNVGVTHQLHERGQAYPGTYHVGGKGVATIPHAEVSPLFRVPDYCRVTEDFSRLSGEWLLKARIGPPSLGIVSSILTYRLLRKPRSWSPG
jgi:hypothetical protein